MKLHHSTSSPNSRRVRIFLAEKGLSIPLVTVDLGKGDLPPKFVPLVMLVLTVTEGRADRAVAPQQRRPDRRFPARWSPARAAGSRVSYVAGPGCSFVSSARSALALPPGCRRFPGRAARPAACR